MRVVAYAYSDRPVAITDWPDWPVDRSYQDWPSSQQQHRPEFQNLLQDCAQTPTDYLLVKQLEDLGDVIDDIITHLEALQRLNIQLVAIEQTDEPIPSAELLARCQALQQFQHSRQIQQGHARNRIKAKPPPGKPPYGYKRGRNRYVVDRASSPIVKAFFEQYLLFASLRGAVRFIGKKYGKKIAVSTGQKWLTNPVYRGDLAYKNGDVIADTHEAIVSREEAAQVDRLLRRNQQFAKRSASAPRSLSGLVTCAKCRSSMTITRVVPAKVKQKNSNNTSEYLYIRPTQCPEKCKAIAYDEVLQATIARVCEDLPKALSGAQLPDLDRFKQMTNAEIERQQQVLAQIPQLLEQRILDEESATLRSYNLRSEIAQLRKRLDRLPPVNLQATAATVSIPQFWADLSETERRFYLREFIREIQIVREGGDWQIKLQFIF